MKRFACVIVCVLILAGLIGCGNMSFGPGNFNFTGVHCADLSGNVQDLKIIKWHNDETGIEVLTEEAGSLFISEGLYILFEKQCPLCEVP